jgi:hypothetical protein
MVISMRLFSFLAEGCSVWATMLDKRESVVAARTNIDGEREVRIIDTSNPTVRPSG